VDHGLPEPVADHMGPAGRFGTRIGLFALALALVGIPFGLLLEQVVRDGPLVRVDTWAANHLHDIVRDSPLTVRVLEIVTFLGKPIWFVVLCVPIGIMLLVRGRVRLTIFLATTAIVGGIIDTAVKVAVNRERPSLEDPVATAFGKSFPSGHSMASVVCYGAILLVFLPAIPVARRRLVIIGTALLVLAIGFSRLALGVHFISDVLGGYVLGAAWLAASTAAFEIWRQDRGRPATRPLEEGVEPEAEPDLHVSHA
jgi:membrane-associated phospholipid phosphatase